MAEFQSNAGDLFGPAAIYLAIRCAAVMPRPALGNPRGLRPKAWIEFRNSLLIRRAAWLESP